MNAEFKPSLLCCSLDKKKVVKLPESSLSVTMRLALHTLICCCIIAAVLPVPVEEAGDASLKKRWASDLFLGERHAAPLLSNSDMSAGSEPGCRTWRSPPGTDTLRSSKGRRWRLAHLRPGSTHLTLTGWFTSPWMPLKIIQASENAGFSSSARA